MHEWLITRGDVRGAPFEWQIQIYVPWNVVIVHEGDCHLKAQHSEYGKLQCLEYIVGFHEKEQIMKWLENIRPAITVAIEKLEWLRPRRFA